MFGLAFAALLAFVPTVPSDPPPPFRPLTWSDLISRPRPAPQETVRYGPDAYQLVDVWLPAGPGPHPVVLMVHGGCWQTSIADRTLMNWIADDLRKEGIAVWNIDYRGVDRPGGGYPGTFRDVAVAADALRDNAARLSLDTRRVVAVGHSAGAHLALWLAARHRIAASSALHDAGPLKIAHVVSLGGLPDLEAVAASPDNGCGTGVVARLVGAGKGRNVYADTSLSRLLPIGTPQDLVNGREDRIIPLRLGTDYAATARNLGDKADLHIIPRTGHVELIAPDSDAWAKSRKLISAALKQ